MFSLGFVAIAAYSVVNGDVAFGLLVAAFAVFLGLCAVLLWELAGLNRQPGPRSSQWRVRVLRLSPLIWAAAGSLTLAAGVINATREGDRVLTVLCFAFGSPVVGTAVTWWLLEWVVRGRIDQR